jgi:Holliday junction resolvase RusA-like endonuclease
MIEIRLDGDPVAKGRHRHRLNTKTGKIFTHPDPKTARFEDRLAWAAQVTMAGRPLLTGPLVVIVDAYRAVPASWSNKRRASALSGELRPTTTPDWDNYGKIVDALNRVVWIDDSQIVDGRARKFYSDRPRIEIRVDNLSTLGL